MTNLRSDCDDSCAAQDLPHVVSSISADEPGDGPVTWGILPNHAEYMVAKPALEAYADATEDVEYVYVQIARRVFGEQMLADVTDEVEQMADEDEPAAADDPS